MLVLLRKCSSMSSDSFSVDSGSSKKCSSMSWDSFSISCRVSSVWRFKLLLHFILFTFYIDFIFGVGWCFTFITECTVTYESVWGSLIPTVLPKLVVKTDCDKTILWKDSLDRLTRSIWCSFCFSTNLSGSVYCIYFGDQNP